MNGKLNTQPKGFIAYVCFVCFFSFFFFLFQFYFTFENSLSSSSLFAYMFCRNRGIIVSWENQFVNHTNQLQLHRPTRFWVQATDGCDLNSLFWVAEHKSDLCFSMSVFVRVILPGVIFPRITCPQSAE